MELVQLLKLLWRRKWIIVASTVVAALAAFAFTATKPDQYKSTALLATGIIDQSSPLGSMDNLYIQPQKIEGRFSNLTEMAYSRSVIGLVSCRLFLNDMKSNRPLGDVNALKAQYSNEEISQASKYFQAKLDSVALTEGNITAVSNRYSDILAVMGYDYGTIKNHLRVSRLQSTDYLQLEFHSSNPQLSAAVVNTLSEEFIKYHEASRSIRTSSFLEFQQDLAAVKKQKLDKLVDSLKNFQIANGIVDINEQTTAMVDYMAQLQLIKDDASKKIPGLQNAIKNIEEEQLGGNALTLNDVKNSSQDFIKVKGELDDLISQNLAAGGNDPTIQKQIEQKRNELDKTIEKSATATYETMGGDRQEIMSQKLDKELELEIAKSNVGSINYELSKLNSEKEKLVAYKAIISALETEIELAREEYQGVVKELNAAQSTSMSAETNLKQVEPGRPADNPEPSKGLFYAAFAGLLGFVMSVGLLLGAEYLDVSVKSPGRFMQLTGIEKLLATLPAIGGDELEFKRLFTADDLDQAEIEFKEALRQIRYGLEASGAKKILFTSTEREAGKSFLMAALGYTLAKGNKRVLLVDTNFKDNGLTRLVGGKEMLNNSNLKGEIKPTPSKVNGVSVIGCRSSDASPMEVFRRGELTALLNEAGEDFDYILMEGAALGHYADSKELETAADGVMCVVAADITLNQADRMSLDYLESLDKKFLGVVLNKVSPENLYE